MPRNGKNAAIHYDDTGFSALCWYSGKQDCELIAEGEIESVVAAGRRLVIVPSWHAYIARQQALPEQDARRNRSGTVPPFGSRRNNRESAANQK